MEKIWIVYLLTGLFIVSLCLLVTYLISENRKMKNEIDEMEIIINRQDNFIKGIFCN